MADISIQQKKQGGADLSWVWAAAAIAAVAGLMVWLATTQPVATTVVTAPSDTAAVAPAAETVELSALGAAPEQYAGREIQVANVPVTAPLGNRAFWADVPNGSPLLVVVDPSIQDASWVQSNATATLQGTIQPVTPEAINGWVQQNQLLSEARPQAEFAQHHFAVTSVQR
jgi:hypothetical protein